MRDRVLRLLAEVAAGNASPDEALDRLAWMPVEPVTDCNGSSPFARLDHHRGLRQGHPEVVYGPGKTVPQLLEICRRFQRQGDGFLATRLDEEALSALRAEFPGGTASETARAFHLPGAEPSRVRTRGTVLVVTGGTGDVGVAEEAALTATAMGNPVDRLYDVGVAGLHRILGELPKLRRAAVVIVAAGMEGALPSVVGGLVGCPVIAVPTSVGYGASFQGVAPLLGMLNSCAAGITVVNIDNGFGAACAATRINQIPDPDTGPDPAGVQEDPAGVREDPADVSDDDPGLEPRGASGVSPGD
ncbi:MAG TPA: nickel pincer cofactor biosynthesis protein LarB [Longimicrobiales bacterium]|nr:nickel pincer cofactor biosynthesis protein LarB [Longimicrobiales bacterium]